MSINTQIKKLVKLGKQTTKTSVFIQAKDAGLFVSSYFQLATLLHCSSKYARRAFSNKRLLPFCLKSSWKFSSFFWIRVVSLWRECRGCKMQQSCRWRKTGWWSESRLWINHGGCSESSIGDWGWFAASIDCCTGLQNVYTPPTRPPQPSFKPSAPAQ